MTVSIESQLRAAVEAIKPRLTRTPDLFLILGSGLGDFVENFSEQTVIPYSEIPHFPTSTVVGHSGNLVAGQLGGKYAVAMQGRFHYYEGYDMADITFPVKVMATLGVPCLIVTNAAGIINADFKPCELMLITDHLNLMGDNPLRGENYEELGPRFPDMNEIYSRRLGEIAHSVAADLGFSLREGIYAAVSGPCYETPSETRYMRIIGGDAAGMSTVPEAIVAHYCGMEVLGISCLTNYAAGLSEAKPEHREVLENAAAMKEKFQKLLTGVIIEL